MKTIIKNISLLLCIVAAFTSCKRKPLYDSCVCTNTILAPISIDWSASGITPQNVTILFYNTEDGSLAYEHKFEHNHQTIQSYAPLPNGSYIAVIFNELRDQIDYISCVGYENISTLKFEGKDDDPLRSRAATRGYIKQAGDLAVAVVKDVDVTEDMIIEMANSAENSTKSSNLSADTKAAIETLMRVVPQKKNTTIKITAHVKNINYARMPALVDLVNLSNGYYVYGDRNSDTPATLQFTMNNRTYDEGSSTDGTISTSIVTFGTLTDRGSTSGYDNSTPITLDLLFKQVDKAQSEVSIAMDVTSLITHNQQSDGSYLITIDAEFDNELPEVEPEASSGDSGFGAEVEDWSEVDVPLQQ